MSDASWRPPTDDPFVRLTDEGRLADAIRERSEERDLRQQQSEFATFTGTMRDLAEAGRSVTVRSGSGRSYQGTLLAVAVDHLVLTAGTDRRIHIAVDQITSVQLDPTSTSVVAAGEREAAQDRTLGEVLADAVEERPVVVLVTRGDGEAHRGQLLAVGEDVVTLRAEGAGARYLPSSALSEVVIER
ncbi:MAG: DUF2642 domain-containing protein [Nitriliruptor sp.]